MQANRFKYIILKNADGKYWLWFDEMGKMVEGVYRPNLQPYHELVTNIPLREGAEVWSEDLSAIPEMCQLRPLGQYSEAYVVKAKLKNEERYAAAPYHASAVQQAGRRPGQG